MIEMINRRRCRGMREIALNLNNYSSDRIDVTLDPKRINRNSKRNFKVFLYISLAIEQKYI